KDLRHRLHPEPRFLADGPSPKRARRPRRHDLHRDGAKRRSRLPPDPSDQLSQALQLSLKPGVLRMATILYLFSLRATNGKGSCTGKRYSSVWFRGRDSTASTPRVICLTSP